jgi:xanthosine utilization system XapX-like protein
MNMTLHLQLEYLLALIAGVLILISPRLLNFIVAIYLIAVGVIGILGIRIN